MSTSPKPSIRQAEADRLVATYEPSTLILAIMEAAKTAGWPHGFVIMETDMGNTATLTTTGGLTPTMRKHIRESLKGDSK